MYYFNPLYFTQPNTLCQYIVNTRYVFSVTHTQTKYIHILPDCGCNLEVNNMDGRKKVCSSGWNPETLKYPLRSPVANLTIVIYNTCRQFIGPIV